MYTRSGWGFLNSAYPTLGPLHLHVFLIKELMEEAAVLGRFIIILPCSSSENSVVLKGKRL